VNGRVPHADSRQTSHENYGQVVLYDNSHQQGVPRGQHLVHQSLVNDKKIMTDADFM